jgi:ABC-type nitrate/sulfonate/bicarbonate transport system permease component
LNPKGLGARLVFEQQAVQPALMFGYVIVIGLVAIALNSSFQWVVRRLAPGLVVAQGGRI